MNFLKVWTELDGGKFKSLPAKLISKNSKGVFTIQYLSPTHKRTVSGKRIYTYEDETYEITSESIIQQVESELEFGFEEKSPGNFVKFDECGGDDDQEEDEDYVPGSSSEDEESDESESVWSSENDDEEEDEEDLVTEDDDSVIE